MKIWVAMGWVFAAALSAEAQKQPAKWCDQVRTMTEGPAVAMAHWGLQVTALDGTVLCAVNAGQLFRPASTNKLFTVAAGLALLGPDKRFTTTVIADGTIKDGVLSGTLRLVGGGDANFGSHDVPYVEPAERPKGPMVEPATLADIEELADQIVARGVRQVNGGVTGDDSYFAGEPYPPGWGVDDLEAGFGAPVSALTIHDSELQMQLAPSAVKAGDEVEISFRPDVPYYGTENTAVTSPSAPQPARGHVRSDRPVGTKMIRIAGDMPLNATPIDSELAIQDPAEFAAKALKDALARRGVTVTGEAQARHAALGSPQPMIVADAELAARLKSAITQAHGSPHLTENPAGCSLRDGSQTAPVAIASHTSPTLAEDVLFTVKESQNLHAEIVLRNLGVLASCEHSLRGGLAVVRAFALQAGIAAGDLTLYDGSGLSARDLVTPRALTTLLVYAAKQPWFAAFKAALPVGGVDGTLANRFLPPDSTLKGKVMAKTGTLGESRALAGYVTAASGKTVVFSVMVDDHPPTGSADRLAMDKMVEAIAAAN